MPLLSLHYSTIKSHNKNHKNHRKKNLFQKKQNSKIKKERINRQRNLNKKKNNLRNHCSPATRGFLMFLFRRQEIFFRITKKKLKMKITICLVGAVGKLRIVSQVLGSLTTITKVGRYNYSAITKGVVSLVENNLVDYSQINLVRFSLGLNSLTNSQKEVDFSASYRITMNLRRMENLVIVFLEITKVVTKVSRKKKEILLIIS